MNAEITKHLNKVSITSLFEDNQQSKKWKEIFKLLEFFRKVNRTQDIVSKKTLNLALKRRVCLTLLKWKNS